MAAFGVEVEFRGDVDGFESEEPGDGVLYVDRVVFRLDEEGGRGVGGGAQVELVEEAFVRVGEVAGVDDDGEIGAAGLAVGGVLGGVKALVVVGAEGGGEMASCGEAENAYAFGVDVPLCRVSADEADGTLGVFKGSGGFGEVGAGIGDAVLEEDAVDADPVEPVADFGAFEVDGEDGVASAGEDDYRCAAVFGFGRIEGDGGRRDVSQADERFAGDEVVFRGGGVGFAAGGGDGIGRGGWPDVHGGVIWGRRPGGLGVRQDWDGEGGEGEDAANHVSGPLRVTIWTR